MNIREYITKEQKALFDRIFKHLKSELEGKTIKTYVGWFEKRTDIDGTRHVSGVKRIVVKEVLVNNSNLEVSLVEADTGIVYHTYPSFKDGVEIIQD